MRFLGLRFQQFAHFDDVPLDLAAGREGLHLIYGPNEAGKSAALRAIHGFLFGIPAQSQDTFKYGGPAVRVHATLRAADGMVRTLVRRKGIKQTLRDDAEQPVGEEVLLALLEGLPPERFTLLFGLGHAELVAGGQQLLKSGGAAGETLFAAAVGGVRLQRLLADVNAQADRLFKPLGRALPLNKLLDDYKQAVTAVRELSKPGKAVAELRARDEGFRQTIGDLEGELRAKRTESARLERLQKALPLLAQYHGYTERLATLSTVPDLAADFAARRQAAQEAAARHAAAVAQAQRKGEAVSADLGALAIPEVLLADGEVIAGLHAELGQYQSAVRDLPAQERLRDAHTQTARVILAELRPGLSLEDAESLRISAVARERIRGRGEALQRAAGKVEQLGAALAELHGERDELERRFRGLPVLPDSEPLRQALQLSQQAIPGEQELANLAQEQANCEERAATELARLGLWSGPLQEFTRLPVPSLESLDEAERARSEVVADLEDRRRRRQEAEEAVARVTEAIQALEGVGAVPSEGDLTVLRGERDAQWTAIRGRWLIVVPEAPAHPATLDTYESTVQAADGVADRLRREAERVTQYARSAAERDRQREHLQRLAEEIQALQEREAMLKDRWDAAWAPCGIGPLPPREMRPWLQRREAVLALAEERRALQARHRTVAEQVGRRREKLAESLVAVGSGAGTPGESLQELCLRADVWLQAADHQRQERAAFERDRQRLRDQAGRAEQDLKAAEATLAGARAAWSEAMGPVGLMPEATPGEAQAVLDRVTELFTVRERAEERENRAQQIARFIADYERRARQVVGDLAPDLLSLPLEDAVRTIERRRDGAAKQAIRREGLLRQADELEQDRETAERDREVAEHLLAELLVEAGCQGVAEIPAVEADAAAKRDARTQLSRVEALLRPFAGGGKLETLTAEAATVNPDTLPSQLAALGQETDDLEARLKQTVESGAVTRSELAAVAGDARAAEKASEAHALLARIRTDARRYLHARLAASFLMQEIERYRETHAGDLVRTAGILFSRVTCAAFSGLGERLSEKEQPILVGVRTESGRTEEVPVEGMSDGTRDQLYLALRLAYIERHLERNPPFPLILDDVLVNFDDDRAAAALGVLGELSARTQVILFTHHHHVLALARAALPDAVLFEHQLTP